MSVVKLRMCPTLAIICGVTMAPEMKPAKYADPEIPITVCESHVARHERQKGHVYAVTGQQERCGQQQREYDRTLLISPGQVNFRARIFNIFYRRASVEICEFCALY